MSIRLKRGMFLSGGKLYKTGDVLPDTPGARALLEDGRAEVVEAPAAPSPKPVKTAKAKPAPEANQPEADGTGNS